MAKVADICVSSSKDRLVVTHEQLTWAKMEELANGLAEVKQQNSLFVKYPLEENETVDDWFARILPLLTGQAERLPDESSADYLTRVHTVNQDKQKLIKDTIRMIAGVFGLESKVDDEGFGKASYPACKDFIVAVLEAVDLNTKGYE